MFFENKKINRQLKILFLLSGIFFFLSCFGGGAFTKSQIEESKMLSEKSKFLSGHTDLQDNRLAEFIKKGNYGKYKDILRRYLNYFQTKTITPIRKWSDENVTNVKAESVFYPFSGPDFLNIYSIYPNAKQYIMIGLETIGEIPNFEKYSDTELSAGLNEIQVALESISRRNFFVTKSMSKDINRSKIKGTIPIFLTYLGFLDLTPLSIQYIKINSLGQVEPLPNNESLQADKNLNGIKIQFIEKDKLMAEENIKTIYYFTADVSNKGFTSNSGIEKFLKNMGDVAVSFKAASYLPHGKNFSNLKDYVQKNAEVIVMDDTGPKINSFDKNWDIRVFGTYGQPIKAFKDKYQKPLEKLFHEQRPKRLDFRFGYGKNEYQIIIKLSKKPNSQDTKQIQ